MKKTVNTDTSRTAPIAWTVEYECACCSADVSALMAICSHCGEPVIRDRALTEVDHQRLTWFARTTAIRLWRYSLRTTHIRLRYLLFLAVGIVLILSFGCEILVGAEIGPALAAITLVPLFVFWSKNLRLMTHHAGMKEGFTKFRAREIDAFLLRYGYFRFEFEEAARAQKRNESLWLKPFLDAAIAPHLDRDKKLTAFMRHINNVSRQYHTDFASVWEVRRALGGISASIPCFLVAVFVLRWLSIDAGPSAWIALFIPAAINSLLVAVMMDWIKWPWRRVRSRKARLRQAYGSVLIEFGKTNGATVDDMLEIARREKFETVQACLGA